MKNIFATIEYVAEKILEAITGHKNDKQAHPNLSEQINVLSTGVSNIENTRKLKTYLGLQDIGMTTESTFLEIAQAMPNNSTILFSSYAPLNWFPQSVTGDRNDIEITRYGGGISYIKVWLSNVKTGVWHGYYTEQTGLVWQQLATTTKTDISLLNGWTVYLGQISAVKIGNLVTIPDVRLKGGTGTKGTILFNLPQGFRPPATRHVMTIKYGTTPTLLTVSSNGNVSILYDDFVGTSDISYTVGFSFLTE